MVPTLRGGREGEMEDSNGGDFTGAGGKCCKGRETSLSTSRLSVPHYIIQPYITSFSPTLHHSALHYVIQTHIICVFSMYTCTCVG